MTPPRENEQRRRLAVLGMLAALMPEAMPRGRARGKGSRSTPPKNRKRRQKKFGVQRTLMRMKG